MSKEGGKIVSIIRTVCVNVASRSNGTTTYSYIYNGGSLVQMTVGGDTLYFTNGTVTYNGVVYYYVTNLQGDVVAILNADGTAVVTYTYDAWGNILTTSGTMAETLGEVNPLRYRGYVYDQETELYYLQSRYYNPEIGRFLNADTFVATGQGFLGNNMFGYCLNNPVIGIDFAGGRAYVINGIHNEEKEDAPEYARRFKKKLEKESGERVELIPVYCDQSGYWGYVEGYIQVRCEWNNIDVYTQQIVETVLKDIAANPLKDGEKIILIGYSGGGQLVLNAAEALEDFVEVDHVILIGAPVFEIDNSSAEISYLYSPFDPLAFDSVFAACTRNRYYGGPVSHTGYFDDSNIDFTVSVVCDIID